MEPQLVFADMQSQGGPPTPTGSALRRLLFAEAVYYAAIGAWSLLAGALVRRCAFERITGPRTDGWLVKSVGVLLTVIGDALGSATRREQCPSRETAAVAVGSASGLAGID